MRRLAIALGPKVTYACVEATQAPESAAEREAEAAKQHSNAHRREEKGIDLDDPSTQNDHALWTP